MSFIPPLFVRLAAALSLLFLVACAPPPGPKAPIRELPPPATSLLALAPSAYGSPAPIALPDDQGSAAAQAAFSAIAGSLAVHEPALDLVAAVVGKTFAEEQELPAQALLQWLYWKCGAVSIPGPVNVFVAPADAAPYFQQHLQKLASVVPKSGLRISFGVARIAVMGNVAQAIALGVRSGDVAPVSKSAAPSSKVPVHIALARPFTDLMLYVDQGGPSVAAVPMKQEADGSFFAEAPMPAAPGRYFVEIDGVELPRDGAAEKGFHISLAWLPFHVGVPEPSAPDEFIRHPKKNHPDISTWSSQVFNAFNDERVRLGEPPLEFEEHVSRLAQQRSDAIANQAGMPRPDPTLYSKLADAGVPSRNLFSTIDEIEFVSEYITLRLLRPAARYALLNPSMTTFALGLSQRRVDPGRGMWNSVEYVFEQIRVDPPKERERIFAELDAAEIARGGAAFKRSEPLSKAAQAIVEEVCRGGPKPTDAHAIWGRVTGVDPSLVRRLAVPWFGYDLSKAEITQIHGNTTNERFSHAGVGVCQGTLDGHRGAVMAMVLFAGP